MLVSVLLFPATGGILYVCIIFKFQEVINIYTNHDFLKITFKKTHCQAALTSC